MREKIKPKKLEQKQEYKRIKATLPKINYFKSSLLFIAFALVAIGGVTSIFLTTEVFQ